MTALENITLAPMKVRGLNKEEAETRAMELFKKVGLTDKANVYRFPFRWPTATGSYC